MSHTKLCDGTSRSHRAMLLAMTGEVSVATAAKRFEIATTTVYAALKRYREAQRNIWPEDEYTW